MHCTMYSTQDFITDLSNVVGAGEREAVSRQLVRLALQVFEFGLHHVLLGLTLLCAEANAIELQQGKASHQRTNYTIRHGIHYAPHMKLARTPNPVPSRLA